MPPRRKRKLTPPVPYTEHNPDEAEVFSIHSLSDDSPSPTREGERKTNEVQATHVQSNGSSVRPKPRLGERQKGQSGAKSMNGRGSEGSITISEDEETDDEDIKLEEVDIAPRTAREGEGDAELEMQLEEVDVFGQGEEGKDEDLEGEEEDHSNAYAAAYEAVAAQHGDNEGDEGDGDAQQPVFKDGKGQPGGISISISAPARKAALAAKKSGITTKDRQTRVAAHKWMVLSLIAHARRRNEMLNDENLRDKLYALVPNNYLEKLRAIHPKKVPVQNERVRQFESFLRDLTRWWSFKFRLDPNLTTGAALRQPDSSFVNGLYPRPGKRVDGWIVESAREREERHREERRKDKEREQREAREKRGKGKARESSSTLAAAGSIKTGPFLSEITLFGMGASTTPIFLRLASATEAIEEASDLEREVEAMDGSRETKAQLFASMCRALGIPCRLVISIQAPSWSVTASKVASTPGAAHTNTGKESNLIKRKRAMGAKGREQRQRRRVDTQRSEDAMTSDDDGFLSAFSAPGSAAEGGTRKRESGSASRPLSVASTTTSANGAHTPPVTRRSARAKQAPQEENGSTAKGQRAKDKGKGKEEGEKGKGEGDDYRDEKWRNLEAPLEVSYQPKLRIQKPKALKQGEIGADTLSDVEPVDATAPPTMWCEVYSKPWQRWITVDPVRGLVEPTGNRQMEPSPSDRTNRLVYVLALEEDGYGRDVTARYTKTLHSRVSRMRPPPTRAGGEMTDWWTRVVKTVHRPQKLERDAVEDVELEGAAAREPMPTSVAAFKEHPVYTLERHLKRDEVIFPPSQAGSFQGMAVYLRANVVACRSARQWYNQGRVVKGGEEALKWVKSRGYTIANKRAEEEARLQGQQGLQEGLYALFQTELYRPEPVVDGRVPTNSFGNIDLFVESMLPDGASHVPYSGAVRVAKKLGIHYAEAITGFEFRKHRSMPRLTGIVIARENEDLLLAALEEDQHMTAEKEHNKRQERLFKNWKKLLNSLKIQERIQREYGEKQAGGVEQSNDDGSGSGGGSGSEVEMEHGGEAEEDLEPYRGLGGGEEAEGAEGEQAEGGFMLD